jgi:succinate dehydrogenase / fumarate reductase cytochrome b subunit
MSDSAVLKSSIARKVAMALSGFFLLVFLLQHLSINLLSVCSADLFNEVSEFMGTNPLVQYALQPVLFFGLFFHLIMGMVLEAKNNKARPVKYVFNKAGENSSWVSRNMIITGVMVMLFLCLHMVQFFVPSIEAHYITHEPLDSYAMINTKFQNPLFVGIYILSFVFLALHLLHGFQSAFQSVGFRHHRYTPVIKKLGKAYAVLVPLGFIFIALYHYLISL